MAGNRIEIDTGRRASFSRRLLNLFVRRLRTEFEDGLEASARSGTDRVLDEWETEVNRLAPKKTGNLRRNIRREMDGRISNKRFGGGISVTARKKGSFDYATYIHDVYPSKHGDRFKNPTTPGTIPRFIDEPLEKKRTKWEQMLEDELRKEMRRRGLM